MIELKVAKNYYKYIVAALAVLVLATIIKVTTSVVYAASQAKPANEKILTIHDAGTEKGLVTNASTLRDALAQAGVRLDSKDITEPGLDEPLVASSYEVNIYRARPVVVKDGAATMRMITAHRTGKQIAKQAGIELYDADKATLSPAKDIIHDGAAEVLTIDRATRLTFVFYGKTLQTSTRATTVGGMLAEKDIKMASVDTVTPAADTVISSGMTIQLWRNGTQVVTVDEDIEFSTRQIKDADRDRSYKEIQAKGENGKRTVTYEIEMRDGAEVSRKQTNTITTKEAVEQVEVVGVKGMYTTPSENESISWSFLLSKGLSREQAAGIMGNLMQEHKFNTSGDGLAQWTGSRQARLRSMYPDTYMTIQSQLDYLWYELTGPYAGVLSSIKATNSVDESVRIFQNKFEKCGICAEDLRIKYAYNILASH